MEAQNRELTTRRLSGTVWAEPGHEIGFWWVEERRRLMVGGHRGRVCSLERELVRLEGLRENGMGYQRRGRSIGRGRSRQRSVSRMGRTRRREGSVSPRLGDVGRGDTGAGAVGRREDQDTDPAGSSAIIAEQYREDHGMRSLEVVWGKVGVHNQVEVERTVEIRDGFLKRIGRGIKSSIFGDRERRKSEPSLRDSNDAKAALQPKLKGIGALIASMESSCENRVYHMWNKETSQWTHERRTRSNPIDVATGEVAGIVPERDADGDICSL